MKAGRPILIHDGPGGFAGTHVITAVTSSTTARFVLVGAPASGSATLVGNVIELDESLDSITDDSSILISRPERWNPIPTTSTLHAPWTASSPSLQPLVRSTLSRDSTYFTNGLDPVLKFDSTKIYRSGIPSSQLDLFLRKDNTSTTPLVNDNPSSAVSGVSNNTFTIAAADIKIFQVGERVEHDDDGRIYTVQTIGDTDTIIVDRKIKGAAAGNLVRVTSYSYYLRLNSVDINGGLTGSAIVGSNDLIVEIGADAAINIRAHTPPSFRLQDSDNLELEIYRTRGSTYGVPSTPTYYKVTTLVIPSGTSYIDFTDTTPDASLTSIDKDDISSNLEGVELGTGWEPPIPSRYIATVANRVVLANCQGWPTIDYTLRKNIAQVTPALANGLKFSIRRDNTQVAPDLTFEATTSTAAASFTGSGLTSPVLSAVAGSDA